MPARQWHCWYDKNWIVVHIQAVHLCCRSRCGPACLLVHPPKTSVSLRKNVATVSLQARPATPPRMHCADHHGALAKRSDCFSPRINTTNHQAERLPTLPKQAATTHDRPKGQLAAARQLGYCTPNRTSVTVSCRWHCLPQPQNHLTVANAMQDRMMLCCRIVCQLPPVVWHQYRSTVMASDLVVHWLWQPPFARAFTVQL